MSDALFAFTIAKVGHVGLIAAKQIVRNPDGTIWKSHYDRPLRWRFEPAEYASIEAMAAQLTPLAVEPQKCIVMGKPLPHLDLSKGHRRVWANINLATLYAPHRRWLPLDMDDVTVPTGLGRAERLVEAALHVRDYLLPPEFRGVRMIAIPSASTGMQGDAVARLKLFAALDRAWPLEDVEGLGGGEDLPTPWRWIRAPIEERGNPSYVARPIFTGMADPVPAALRRDHSAGKRRHRVAGRRSLRSEGRSRSIARLKFAARRVRRKLAGNCWRSRSAATPASSNL